MLSVEGRRLEQSDPGAFGDVVLVSAAGLMPPSPGPLQVGNTDAEGRLTLADALVYACKLEPDAVSQLAGPTFTRAVLQSGHMVDLAGF
jgi:hypothetical protein